MVIISLEPTVYIAKKLENFEVNFKDANEFPKDPGRRNKKTREKTFKGIKILLTRWNIWETKGKENEEKPKMILTR